MTELSLLNEQISALLTGEHSAVANLANASALINESIPDLNWAGFYLYNSQSNQLDLGPFQGKVACMHIELGKGVCGVAASTKQTQIVDDVTKFSSYIACDSAAKSELVVPMLKKDGTLYGVLDLDAPVLSRFDQSFADQMNEFAKRLMSTID
ncbi:GAF domain-containing protein [Limosilactobacillus fastidiosus]|uniref:GAF domain-containing protein n=1 Tax=Limosilactobacillus fastidiosus TaxID=2759855 RepID=A0A7W3TYP3_9LACO|nr:GAF domain-containing protein [Limosilactobacillus fastidiosus]MBB1063055.1 GAF domain-containing protein [Limosilactobacillus fastidiosus]MBB1085692.1 GAF domain-containing protein [Limosilactobacillus fastidiosus]MCD7083864.1 GAF domain-containing protein [Limosilactobacillus fastidiosus]MCD7086171.1 GAF domain-containing protein [Limosilactobacillus fastidiosus]MCD7114032.1 GAF domain-containing protein [Limosilactobacillus fastidiosus]